MNWEAIAVVAFVAALLAVKAAANIIRQEYDFELALRRERNKTILREEIKRRYAESEAAAEMGGPDPAGL